MKDELISKIGVALSKPIEEECQVVYILVEIRKLLDRVLGEKTKLERYPVLNFYCNWVVHAELGGTTPIDPVLNKIEDLLADPNLHNPKNMPEAMFGFLNLNLFSEEFGKLLKEYSLENPLTKHVYRSKFRDMFVGILRDCPLKPKNRKITEFCFGESAKNYITYTIKFKNNFSMPGFSETGSCIDGSFLFQ